MLQKKGETHCHHSRKAARLITEELFLAGSYVSIRFKMTCIYDWTVTTSYVNTFFIVTCITNGYVVLIYAQHAVQLPNAYMDTLKTH